MCSVREYVCVGNDKKVNCCVCMNVCVHNTFLWQILSHSYNNQHMVCPHDTSMNVIISEQTRAHRAHTLRAMQISPMAMPLLRGLYSLNFNLLLLTNVFVLF